MLIRDLLAGRTGTDAKCVQPDSSLREAAGRMTSHNVGALVVTDDGGKLVGIVSERDLARAIAKYDDVAERTVSDVMTRSVVTCSGGQGVADMLSLMKSHHIRHLPVLEGDRLIGMVSTRELTQAYEALQAQANTDALTGLSNRRHFLENLDVEWARSRRYGRALSVAMIDVDRFKRVNDKYGHEAGDKVLSALARHFDHELRTVDRTGRLGGEEFAAIFPETDIEGARIACDRLLRTIRGTAVEVDGGKISITVSIGLTRANPGAGGNASTEDPAAILKRADGLLYAATSQGRDRV
ncbi:MAG: diguanylate cyclase, partial [Bradyrhizobium sp.]